MSISSKETTKMHLLRELMSEPSSAFFRSKASRQAVQSLTVPGAGGLVPCFHGMRLMVGWDVDWVVGLAVVMVRTVVGPVLVPILYASVY